MTTLTKTSENEKKPSGEGWDFESSQHFMGGVELSLSSRLIPKESLLQGENVRLHQGQLIKDLGYVAFADTVRGAPRRTKQFTLQSGVTVLILITNATFYKYSVGADEWQYVSDGVDTTVSVAGAATDLTIDVADITGFSDDDYIGIALDDGTQHKTRVNGAPGGSTITFDDALPSVASIGNAVVKAIDLTGVDANPVRLVYWPASDKLYFTNGVDAPQEFDNSTVEEITSLPGSTFVCKDISIYSNFLVFYNTVEDGTAKPQRVRWGAVGVDNSFPALNFNDLYDTEGEILRAEKLAIYNIIYKSDSVTRMEFVGTTDKTFDFPTTVEDKGTSATEGIVNLGDRHLMWSEDNIYEYDGGFGVLPIGDSIRPLIFTQSGILDPTEKGRLMGFYVKELDEAWFIFAKAGIADPTTLLRYDVEFKSFTVRELTDDIVGYGAYVSQAARTWNDLVGSWESQEWSWNSQVLQANAPTVHLCGKTDLQVFEYDYIASTDDGTAITYVVETKDFNILNYLLRFDRFNFEVRGTTILIEISLDEGNTFETLGTLSPGANYAKEVLHLQRVSDTIRFRLSGSDGFGLKSLGFRYKREIL